MTDGDRLTTQDIATGSSEPDLPTPPDSAGVDRGAHGEPRGDRGSQEGRDDRDAHDEHRDDRAAAEQRDEPLLPPSDLDEYRQRWDTVQTQFVDEPRRAVEDADALVAELMKKLADTFASERSTLEEQWDRSGEPDTETLRVTLQRYRSFFNRLLSA
jgi:hypothetical protein